MRYLSFLALATTLGTGCVGNRWFAKPPGAVEISGTVETPLIRGEPTNYLPVVPAAGRADDKGWQELPLFAIDLAGSGTTISTAHAADLGLKVKCTGCDPEDPDAGVKRTVIPELHVGDVVFRDVNAQVGKASVLGVGRMPTLQVAILPSEGVVRFAPSGSTLLSALGTPIVTRAEGTKAWKEHGAKTKGKGLAWLVPGKVNDADGEVALYTSKGGSQFADGIPLVDMHWQSGVRYGSIGAVVGNQSLPRTWGLLNQGIISPDGKRLANLGYDVLYGFDLAIDGATGAIAMKPASASKADLGYDRVVGGAKRKFEHDAEAATKAVSERKPAGPGGDPGVASEVGRQTKLADVLAKYGDPAEAIEHYQAAAAVAGDGCAPYHALGKALLDNGRPKDALEPLRKAGELWDKWYAQPLAVRRKIERHHAMIPGTFTVVEPQTCLAAWGDLAAAHLALGENDKVAEIFAAHDEFDANLGVNAGLSFLTQGKFEASSGPIHRALDLGAREDGNARIALASAFAGQGKVDMVLAQAERLAEIEGPLALEVALPFLDAAQKAGGTKAMVDSARMLAESKPQSAVGWLVLAVAAKRGGDAATEASALQSADQVLPASLARRPGSQEAAAWDAVAKALHGDNAAAKQALEGANGNRRAKPVLFAARAVIAELSGDAAAVADAKQQLAKAYPMIAATALGNYGTAATP